MIMEQLERIEQKLDNLWSALLHQKTVLSITEAADFTGLSVSYLYKLIHFNKISYSKPNGKRVYFERRKLEEWMANGSIESSEEMLKKVNAHMKRRYSQK
jgi:excisionase family DNA binding protein